jgi:hypothetical protein
MREISEVQDMFRQALKDHNVKHYAKFKKVDARESDGGEEITTFIKGKEETKNITKKGDFVVRAQTESKEKYIVEAKVFNKRYTKNPEAKPDKDGFVEYFPIGEVFAFEYHGKDFSFNAPWNEEMKVVDGDFIGAPDPRNLSDIYRIERETFFNTYKEKK